MKPPRSAPPPAHAVELRRWSLTSGDDLHAMRSELTGELSDRRLGDGELGERMTLAATELASNALRHGLPPVQVQLLRTPEDLIIAVSDGDVTGVPQSDGDGGLVAGGRGLLIVGAVADDLCWHADGTVKYVWASFLG
ncbi:hypothetical protein GCM10010435_25930 [Winogradskya consettensis]|uniref:Histidine kinase/HSP90-like ATPase domain-containing protein n=1 Tax=Winogradskya consettensis TaxID=113560 RepID=A0A919VLL2_9ACTN|nr:ATP-binding protein [Actinoplanes consettensis]GIM67978.1 hypothetical protein Aco04nite_08720 [Actinoplanes consettensis]